MEMLWIFLKTKYFNSFKRTLRNFGSVDFDLYWMRGTWFLARYVFNPLNPKSSSTPNFCN